MFVTIRCGALVRIRVRILWLCSRVARIRIRVRNRLCIRTGMSIRDRSI